MSKGFYCLVRAHDHAINSLRGFYRDSAYCPLFAYGIHTGFCGLSAVAMTARTIGHGKQVGPCRRIFQYQASILVLLTVAYCCKAGIVQSTLSL
jgi:hypothetical protein